MPRTRFDIIKPQKKSIWKLPAVVNMAAGPAAAGYFLFSAAFVSLFEPLDAAMIKRLFSIAPMVMLIGLWSIMLELGKPRNMRHTLSNLKSSWMSREVLAAALFLGLCPAVIFSVAPSGWLLCAAAISALAFILSQGMLMQRCLAVTTWNRPLVVLFFFSSAMASGFALFQLVLHLSGPRVPSVFFGIGVGCVLLNAAVWVKLARSPLEAIHERFRPSIGLTVSVGFGHLVPILVIVSGRLLRLQGFSVEVNLLMVTGTVGILAGTVLQKYILILDGSVVNGVTLPVDIETVSNRLTSDNRRK
ncbi:MAG: dimethyl sulfoxide reductase anchor subunit [Desulfobacteraceae bacterium]|nr:dimethyl sulfoxide reductase anchor subunit [Desulfobacteraceae bacterium]